MAPSGRGLGPQAVEENACLSVKAFLGVTNSPLNCNLKSG